MVSHCACPTRVLGDRALHEYRRPSSLPSPAPFKLTRFLFRGKRAERCENAAGGLFQHPA